MQRYISIFCSSNLDNGKMLFIRIRKSQVGKVQMLYKCKSKITFIFHAMGYHNLRIAVTHEKKKWIFKNTKITKKNLISYASFLALINFIILIRISIIFSNNSFLSIHLIYTLIIWNGDGRALIKMYIFSSKYNRISMY